MADNTNNSGEEIRTLHVSGLPLDVKEREVHNLFRFFPGYQGCTVKLATHSCAAFVAFATRAQALVAKEALNGIRFDLNFPYPLKIEEARQNTKSVARPPDPMSFPFSCTSSPLFSAVAIFL